MSEVAWDLRELAGWRNREVISADGVTIGTMKEIVYDYVSETPIWILVAPQKALSFRQIFIPVRGAVQDGDLLRAAYSNDQIEHEPPADLGEGFHTSLTSTTSTTTSVSP
jgi:hypothetical protein